MSKDVGQQIIDILNEYKDQTAESLDHVLKEVCKDTVENLKATSPKRTGKYASSWESKKDKKNNYIIYNTRYQLTHLLENGHATRGGGRSTAAQPHIAPAEERADEQIQNLLKKELE